MYVAKKRTVTIVTIVTSECRVSVKNNKKMYFIRRPQQRCRTFAT